ncbi:polyprenol phosphomannose-dependent alpha 1,6 mannosyltransferase MptB [Actinokineospora guangxiensis]|uniref:Polyprenol phosphomannose-dependent alpha 1,6 mannosyltransferase MptB n=1 Tax=Actinokineospora guangxiensis TaxID=1490288 RepID=A0ABW0EK31_9PSEU
MAATGPGGVERLRWAGFTGSVALTLGSWVWLGSDWPSEAGTVALAVCVGGMLLVLLSWALLGRGPVTGEGLPDERWLRRTLALWAAPLLLAPALFSRDVYSYLAQGEVAARGLNPNTVDPLLAMGELAAPVNRVGEHWQATPSPYGPLTSTLQRLVTEVTGGDMVAGVLLHRLLALVGLALAVWALARLAEVAGASARTALWLGALNPLVLWHLVAGAHNDSLMLGLMLAGTALSLTALPPAARTSTALSSTVPSPAVPPERVAWVPFTAGVLLVCLGAEVKLPALLALAVVGTALARSLGGGWARFLAAGAGMGAVFAAVSVAVCLPTGLGLAWIGALGTSGEVTSWMAPTSWPGFLAGGVGSAFGADITQTALAVTKAIGYAVALAAIGCVLLRQLRGGLGPVPALAAIMAALVAFGPVVQPWYLLWAALPVAACATTPRLRAWTAGVCALVALLVPPLAGDFSGAVAPLVTGYLLGLLAVAACLPLLLRTRRLAPVRA